MTAARVPSPLGATDPREIAESLRRLARAVGVRHLRVCVTFLTLLATVGLATPALAARASKTPGIDAYERGDYMTAFKLLSPKAKAGEAEAQYRLGIIRDEGSGCKKNYILIQRRIQKGCPPDHQKALEWLRLAAEQDHIQAQVELGRLYLRRPGRDPD